MNISDNKNTHYITPNWPAPKRIKSFTSLRTGGHSIAPYANFNLSHYVNDDPRHVQLNRDKVMQDWVLTSNPKWLNQTHSTRAINCDEPITSFEADACFTTKPNQPCAVLTADCLPLLVCNKSGTEVAAIHAGWRGLISGIIKNTVESLQSPPNELLVWLGPAIGPNAFEIDTETANQFITADAEYTKALQPKLNKYHANLYTMARIALHKLGVKHIFGGEYCTFTNHESFFSYRREQTTGRMVSLIVISN